MSKVTSLDVAEKAGVSRSAVSRVFTPGASVSKGTAEKVRKAAAALGYRPNVLARSLNTGRSRIIGLVVAYLENQFYPEAIERLSKALQAEGYHVLVFMASNDNEATQSVIDELLDYQVDGIIAASVGLSNDLTRRCEGLGIPILLFNRHQYDDKLTSITSDNVGGGRQLADFLVAGGHKRIAYIAGWEGASTQMDREAGFQTGLEAAGMTLFARETGVRFDQAAINLSSMVLSRNLVLSIRTGMLINLAEIETGSLSVEASSVVSNDDGLVLAAGTERLLPEEALLALLR